MVLESILNPSIAKRRPLEVFFFGGFAATIGLFLSYWIFQEYASLIMVFLVTLASVPLLYSTIRSEEEVDVRLDNEPTILREHSRVLVFLMVLFMGMTLALSFWYVVLPQDMTTALFSSQTQTITDINNQISGNVTQLDIITRIFLNNVRVLVFAVMFAFLYGVGAIFILTWNATVIAAAMGNFIRQGLSATAQTFGFDNMGTYLAIFSLGIFRYVVHGIPEILAYFIGGLAGGIISVAVMKKDIFRSLRERILFDAAELILIAVGLLLAASFIEVFITPVLF
jgi:uncharacterized membrane protein SpoIIM required for sporulation